MNVDSDLLERYEKKIRAKNKYSDRTAVRYRKGLKKFITWLSERNQSIESLEGDRIPLAIECYLDELSVSGYAGSTIVGAYSSIAKYYSLIERFDRDDDDWPLRSVKLSDYRTESKQSQESREKTVYLEPEEVRLLYENVKSLRDELILGLFYQTGLRRQELCDIRLSDIDTDERSINIRGKGAKNRTVFWRKYGKLDILVEGWINGNRNSVLKADESDYLFPTQKSDKIDAGYVGRIVKEAADDAGLQEVVYTDSGGQPRYKVTCHTLRHSFAVSFINNNGNVRHLQLLMGHEKIETTEEYLKLADKDIRDSARNFSPDISDW